MDSLKWKSSEVLVVSANAITTGPATASIVVDDKLTPDTKPTDFKHEHLTRAYENIDSHVPLYIKHKFGAEKKAIGFAFKFGLEDNGLPFKGYVFDKDAYRQITTEGYDKISPELDLTIENDNLVDVRITGLAFVPNPAMQDTDVNITATVFSRQTEDSNRGEAMTAIEMLKKKGLSDQEIESVKAFFEEGTDTQQSPSTPPSETTPPAQVTPPTTGGNVEEKLNTLIVQVQDYKSKYEETLHKNEQLLGLQYDNIARDIKSLGIEDPGEIVKGLPTEQKIVILTKMKERIAKNQPLVTPTDEKLKADTPNTSNEKLLSEALKELGITKEEYDKLNKGGL